MGMTDNLKEHVRLVLEHSDSLGHLLHDGFSPEALHHIQKGEFLVSQNALRVELERIEDLKPVLKSLRCSEDGIVIEFEGKRFWGKVAVQLHVRIEELKVTEEVQTLTLGIVDETRAGQDLCGRILCGIGSVLVGSFTRYAIERSKLGKHAEFEDENRRMRISLGELEQVRALLEPKVPTWEGSVPLRLLAVDGCSHVEGGILVRLSLSPVVREWLERLPHSDKEEKTAQSGAGIVERAKNIKKHLDDARAESRELFDVGRKALNLGKTLIEGLVAARRDSPPPEEEEKRDEAKTENATGLSKNARFVAGLSERLPEGSFFRRNGVLRKTVEGLGYDFDAAMAELKAASSEKPSASCAGCGQSTLHMTACCQKAICLTCFRQNRFSQDGSPYAPPGYAGHRKLGATYDFRCPYCGQEAHVKDYDPDSDALTYAKMDGYEPPVLVVRIDEPTQDSGWL